MTLPSRARTSLIAVSLALLVALLVSGAQGSAGPRAVASKTKTAGGSLQLTVNPSPQCGEFTFPGRCDFEPSGRLKVKSRSECRARDVKIYRADVGAHGSLVTTPGTNRRGVASTHLGGRYSAYHPAEPFNPGVYDVLGGSKMTFRAVSAGFRTFEHNNPLRPLRCKTLKTSGLEQVTVPMPPPPEP